MANLLCRQCMLRCLFTMPLLWFISVSIFIIFTGIGSIAIFTDGSRDKKTFGDNYDLWRQLEGNRMRRSLEMTDDNNGINMGEVSSIQRNKTPIEPPPDFKLQLELMRGKQLKVDDVFHLQQLNDSKNRLERRKNHLNHNHSAILRGHLTPLLIKNKINVQFKTTTHNFDGPGRLTEKFNYNAFLLRL